MSISRLSLLLVVFIDVMGQGLMLPLLSSILLDSTKDFLPHAMPAESRELRFGVVMGLFYLSWFFGAAFISKLSDYIGRKNGILICLSGTFLGYVLTAVALLSSSLVLLILGRVVAGFTAGNQPIAQAALIDVSRDDQEKTRFMGYIVAAAALGLMSGPLLVGLLGSKAILGSFASLQLPVYFASGLVLINIVLIQLNFSETMLNRRKIDFGLSEVFLTLWRVAHRPVVLRISCVYFFAILGLNAYFIFLNDYMFATFQFGTLQNSIIMIVAGGSLALVSATVAGRVAATFSQIRTIVVSILIMAVFVVVFLFNPYPFASYFIVVPILGAFAITYPTLLSMFSESVDSTDQGWVMGVAIALFTFGSGSISLIGGSTMAVDPRLPFFISIGAFAMALLFVALLWNDARIRKLDPMERLQS